MNLLLIDKNIRSLETFLNGCNTNTKYIVYDINDKFDEIKNKISNFGINNFSNLGFVFENKQSPLMLFVEGNPFISFDQDGIKENLTTNFIKSLVDLYNINTLDFLACDLLLNETWRSYFIFLQNQSSDKNLIVRSSNDKTGNLQSGGDWVLETTNEDVSSLYFNENINQWSELLGIGPDYNAILLDDPYNNIYTTGSTNSLNQPSLLRANGDYRNSKYIFNKNIISIASCNDCFAFLTDETSNNLYVIGVNTSKLGVNGYEITEMTNVTTNILNKKITHVSLQRAHNQSLSTVMYVLTDESINNLYVCGSGYLLGVSDNVNTLERVTYLNQKVLMVSPNVYNYCELITDEANNNVYYVSDTTNKLFVKKDLISLYDKKAIYIQSHAKPYSAILTNETTDNFYICCDSSPYTTNIGLGTTTSVSEYTKVSDYSPELQGKKIEKIYMSNAHFNISYFALTNESSNNLYVCGNNSSSDALCGIGSSDINTYQKVSNYSTELLNKKVIDVNINIQTTAIITNESSNNLYSTGKNNYYSIGDAVTGATLNTTFKTFKNVSLVSELLNKKVNIVSGYIDTGFSLSITNENPSNGNIYVCGMNSYNNYIDKSLLYFGKMKYFNENKKFIKISRCEYFLFAISDEASNNVYYTSYAYGSYNFINYSLQQTELNNKKVTDLNTCTSFTYFITDEPSNNLYCMAISAGGKPSGDGTTSSYSEVKRINNNIEDKKVIKISCNNLHKCLLTDETSNNYYVCGSMEQFYNEGAFGNGELTGVSTVFTNVRTGVINNKKFIDVNCDGNNTPNTKSTFLISNEFNNNLYACGMGYLGDNNNSSGQSTFLNITNDISGKKVIKVSKGYTHVAILTSEINNNLYMIGDNWAGTGSNTSLLKTFTNVTNNTLLNKQITDVTCDLYNSVVYTNESNNNIYVAGDNGVGQLGIGNKTAISNNFERLTYLNKKSYFVNPTISSSSVSFNVNASFPDNATTPKYTPKNFNIGNDNVITFANPLNTSIAVAPIATATAVENYGASLGVNSTNVVSGYIKFEPPGTVFQNHISVEFDVEKNVEPVVYFKSGTDTVPQLIPSTNTSVNDVFYNYSSSTGVVTLCTKHFSEAIVTQNSGSSPASSSVHFNLSYLDTSITMSVSGDILKLDIPTLEVDAVAEYYVTASDMRNVFMFQSDSDDVDTITNGTDVKYFVRKNLWPSGLVLNPCHAWVQSAQQIATTDKLGVIADNRELVKHDFVRHIAKSLFNTHLAVDLFTNENDLKYDLAYKGHNTAWGNIWSSITGVSDASLNTTSYSGLYGQDAIYGYYLTGDASANTNISRQLLSQLVKTAPTRLQNLNTYVVDASNGYYSVPLVTGDSISFKLTLQTAPNQHLLVNRPTAVPSRSYQIRINLRDSVSKGTSHADAVNVTVNDTEPVLYGGVAVTNSFNTSYPANY